MNNDFQKRQTMKKRPSTVSNLVDNTRWLEVYIEADERVKVLIEKPMWYACPEHGECSQGRSQENEILENVQQLNMQSSRPEQQGGERCEVQPVHKDTYIHNINTVQNKEQKGWLLPNIKEETDCPFPVSCVYSCPVTTEVWDDSDHYNIKQENVEVMTKQITRTGQPYTDIQTAITKSVPFPDYGMNSHPPFPVMPESQCTPHVHETSTHLPMECEHVQEQQLLANIDSSQAWSRHVETVLLPDGRRRLNVSTSTSSFDKSDQNNMREIKHGLLQCEFCDVVLLDTSQSAWISHLAASPQCSSMVQGKNTERSHQAASLQYSNVTQRSHLSSSPQCDSVVVQDSQMPHPGLSAQHTPLNCDVCGVHYHTEEGLADHVTIHPECPWCGLRLQHLKQMQQHVSTHIS